MLPNNAVVDLYCGAGGLAHGFFLEGFSVTAGIDIDVECKYAFEKNNGTARFVEKDIHNLTSKDLEALFLDGSIKILVGCAPCQPFSPYARTNKNKDEEKWKLLNEFERLIREVKPEIVSMENVHDLIFSDVYTSFYEALIELGYHVNVCDSVYTPDYGVPQTRTRLVLLASRLGNIEMIPPTCNPGEYKKVSDFITGLPEIKAGETDKKDSLHRASRLSKKNLERIQASKPGGTWNDWPNHLIAECHKRENGKTYKNVYGRMSWNEPAPTMTTQCNAYGTGRFGHPDQDRAISLREAALLQTFPIDYKFVPEGEPYHISIVSRMIGNAVPVELGRAIAKSIKSHLLSLQQQLNQEIG
ncbi:MAG TPA: DNA (cytosine-5-)-methyltransferase [Bellilinea sp.]|nr:DNA (cytosine-5-)-methyltransferase [Bellilinea sp.]